MTPTPPPSLDVWLDHTTHVAATGNGVKFETASSLLYLVLPAHLSPADRAALFAQMVHVAASERDRYLSLDRVPAQRKGAGS